MDPTHWEETEMRATSNLRTAAGSLAVLCLFGCLEDEPSGSDEQGLATALTAQAAERTAAQTATIRFVNLWLHEGTGTPVDVYLSPFLQPEQPLFEGLEFGAASAAVSIRADASVNAYLSGDPRAGEGLGSPEFIASAKDRDIGPGDRLTLVLRYSPPFGDDPVSGGIVVFKDTGDAVTDGMPARDVDGALLVAYAGPVRHVVGETHKGYWFGIPDEGCLRPAGASPRPGISVSAGGWEVLPYDVPPSRLQVAAWRDSGCSGPPEIGPVAVDVAGEERAYVFAYGTGPDDLRLLPLAALGGE